MKHSISPAGERLPLREVISYGAGDMACSMVFNFMSSYLLYFYTDVAGIAVGAAGAVMSAARLIDAAANPVVGVLSDKTQTRWGKLRPYLLFSAVPLALSVVLMFAAAWVPQGGRAGYALATYALFCVLYTLCNVPYSAMLPNISEDPGQRGRLNMSRFILASMGTLVSMGLALPLAGLFGQGDERRGFFGLALLFAGIIILFVLVCFANTKERIQPPPVAFSLKTLGRTVKKSKPWALFCTVQLFHYVALTTRNSSALYYAKYCLDNAGFASLLLAVNAFATLVTALFIPILTQKITKRNISMLGYGLFAAGSLLTYWAGQNLTVIFLLNVLANLGICLSAGVSFLILGEVIDHSEYAAGMRQQGLLTSISMLMVKLGVVISSVVSAAVLELGGYAADQPQSARALGAIRMNFIFLPAIVGIVCAAAFMFYRLDREYPEVRAALEMKRVRERRRDNERD